LPARAGPVAELGPACGVRRITRRDEARESLALLLEAAAWTAARGRPIWPSDAFSLPAQIRLARAGELIGGFADLRMTATMQLQDRDPVHWPHDAPGEALYVHKLAVRRANAGQGWTERLLDWASAEARRAGAAYLRLDTDPATPLPDLYRRAGFVAAPSGPAWLGGRYVLRMQRPLPADGR